MNTATLAMKPPAESVHWSGGQWLTWLETLDVTRIELGLNRVHAVLQRLTLPPPCPIIMVAGTNGKGSVCTMLSSVLQQAGYRVGLFTSPHLLTYHERVQVNSQPIADADLAASFQQVAAAQADVPLTYFEWSTLAARVHFQTLALDAMIFEVGLGGRLDAVNVFDADVSVITAIDLDHQAWLGPDREHIGREKAGIMRSQRPCVVLDRQPPASVEQYGQDVGAQIWRLGRDFGLQTEERQAWHFWSRHPQGQDRHSLPFPALRGRHQLDHAAGVLAVLDLLKPHLPVTMQDIRRGLLEVHWPGRFQVLPGQPVTILDVGHNPHAARALADNLDDMGFFPVTHAVFGMLADKDSAQVIAALASKVQVWHCATLGGPRGQTAAVLQQHILAVHPQAQIYCYAEPWAAYRAASEMAKERDRILVFGSFHTVADVLERIRSA